LVTRLTQNAAIGAVARHGNELQAHLKANAPPEPKPEPKPNPNQGHSRFGHNSPSTGRKNEGDWAASRKALVEEVRTMSLAQRTAILEQHDANYKAWKTKHPKGYEE
jgi:hypothetical protein